MKKLLGMSLMLVMFALVIAGISSCGPTGPQAPADAKAAVTKFFDATIAKNYQAQVELLDPAMFEALAKKGGQSVAKLKKAYIQYMKSAEKTKEQVELLGYSIAGVEKVSDAEYSFKMNEKTKENGEERNVEETWSAVLVKGKWYVRTPKAGN